MKKGLIGPAFDPAAQYGAVHQGAYMVHENLPEGSARQPEVSIRRAGSLMLFRS